MYGGCACRHKQPNAAEDHSARSVCLSGELQTTPGPLLVTWPPGAALQVHEAELELQPPLSETTEGREALNQQAIGPCGGKIENV